MRLIDTIWGVLNDDTNIRIPQLIEPLVLKHLIKNAKKWWNVDIIHSDDMSVVDVKGQPADIVNMLKHSDYFDYTDDDIRDKFPELLKE